MPATPRTGEIKMSDVRSLTTDLIVNNTNYNPGAYNLSITQLATIARQGKPGDVPPIGSNGVQNLSLSSFYRSTIPGFMASSTPCTKTKYYHTTHDGTITVTPTTNTFKVSAGIRGVLVEAKGPSEAFAYTQATTVTLGTPTPDGGLFDGTYLVRVSDFKAGSFDHEADTQLIVNYGGSTINYAYYNYIH